MNFFSSILMVRFRCLLYYFRLGQMLNLYWEKTPENVFYQAVNQTVTDLQLVMQDYTAVEDVFLIGFTSKYLVQV